MGVALFLVYLLIPADGWGLFHGRPLDLLSTSVALAATWTIRGRRLPRVNWLLATAIVVKIALGLLIVPRGFDARYFANDRFAPPIEQSIEPADATFTRVDHRLTFGRPDAPDLPLYFFNDLRFNFYRPGEPDHETLPFSVVWQGYWRVSEAGPHELYVRAPNGTVDMAIGDAFHTRVQPTDRWSGVAVLPRGVTRMTIALAVPQGGARQFEAGQVDHGRDVPFDSAIVYRRAASSPAFAASTVIRSLSIIIDACLLLWVAFGFADAVRRADRVALAWLATLAYAVAMAAPSFGRMVTLSGGNDWLTYEAQARDIELHGPLMLMGTKIGEGIPYYTQPLYPYFVAMCHWMFGDSLFGVYLVQRLFVGVTIIALWRLIVLMFDERAGLIGALTAGVVVFVKFVPWTSIVLTENLFVPLIATWSFLLVRLIVSNGDVRQAAVCGLVGGLAAYTRSSMLLGCIGLIPMLAVALAGSPTRWRAIGAFIGAMLVVVGIALARNWVVARKVVPISSEGTIVLFLGNPPPDLPMPPAHRAQYDRLGFDLYLRAVVEYLRQQPRPFAIGLLHKLEYVLGIFGAWRPELGTVWFYVAVWVTALAGALALPWLRPKPSVTAAYMPLLIALSHVAIGVVFLPDVYVDRMIMPIYMLLAPYSACCVIAIRRAATR